MFSSMQPSGGSCSSCWVATAQDQVGGDTSPCQAAWLCATGARKQQPCMHWARSPEHIRLCCPLLPAPYHSNYMIICYVQYVMVCVLRVYAIWYV